MRKIYRADILGNQQIAPYNIFEPGTASKLFCLLAFLNFPPHKNNQYINSDNKPKKSVEKKIAHKK